MTPDGWLAFSLVAILCAWRAYRSERQLGEQSLESMQRALDIRQAHQDCFARTIGESAQWRHKAEQRQAMIDRLLEELAMARKPEAKVGPKKRKK